MICSAEDAVKGVDPDAPGEVGVHPYLEQVAVADALGETCESCLPN